LSGIETPMFLASEGRRIFAVWHQPAADAGKVTDTAFVFCPPFAEEEKCCHRAFVDMARKLCSRGHPVLRIQYRGCGDSEGDFGDFSCADWEQDINNALAFLRRQGRPRLGLLGLRLGASLAGRVAESTGDVQNLILWEPIVNGRQYMSLNLRRKLLRRMLTDKEGGESPPASQATMTDGRTGIDFEGYWISAEMQTQIGEIDLIADAKRFRGEVLLTQISSQSSPGKTIRSLEDRYASAGASVAVEAVVEQPIWNLLDLFHPTQLIDSTIDWMLARNRCVVER